MARIGFISTRFAGSDGVSLESEKWARLFEELGHEVFWLAGQLDRDMAVSRLVPEAFFDHPANVRINDAVWGRSTREPGIRDAVVDLAGTLRKEIQAFIEDFGIDVLVPENALTIPMHIPLGVAITETVAETGLPTIAHHHDFYWERSRFTINGVRDYLDMAFPPSLPQIQHAVINSVARDQLAWRKGLSSIIVPNVIDFERPAPKPARPVAELRARMGVGPDDLLILQPTRVVPRKGIEHAIAMVSRLRNPRCRLIVSHESGDEGEAYLHALTEMAHEAGVDMRFIQTTAPRCSDGEPVPEEGDAMSLWDVYPCADLVTYPSLYEGFGNAFLEAFYFRVPILVNRYSIWIQDIEPKGFRTISMNGMVTQDVVERVRQVLANPAEREAMVEHNYKLALRYYSYAVLRRRLQTLLVNAQGLY